MVSVASKTLQMKVDCLRMMRECQISRQTALCTKTILVRDFLCYLIPTLSLLFSIYKHKYIFHSIYQQQSYFAKQSRWPPITLQQFNEALTQQEADYLNLNNLFPINFAIMKRIKKKSIFLFQRTRLMIMKT